MKFLTIAAIAALTATPALTPALADSIAREQARADYHQAQADAARAQAQKEDAQAEADGVVDSLADRPPVGSQFCRQLLRVASGHPVEPELFQR